MTDMIVAGAGSSAVNGTYVESGTYNGKPIYYYGSYKIFWFGGWWRIRYGAAQDYYLNTNEDVATPDLCTWWGAGAYGEQPTPTVTAAGGGDPPSGTTHEGEATLSSLSYLRTKKS